MISNFSNLLARRDLLWELVRSRFLQASAGTKLGWLWWLLDPILMMFTYWLLFAIILERGGETYAPFPVFILGSLLAWKHFGMSARQCCPILRSHAPLIKAIQFPTIVLPLSIVISGVGFFLFGLLILFVAAQLMPNAHHSGSWWPLVQVVPLVILQTMVIGGICLMLASFGALIHDLNQAMAHVLRIGYYMAPGIYDVDRLEALLAKQLTPGAVETVIFIYMLNPFAILFTGYRDIFFRGAWLEPQHWIVLIIEAIALLWIGNRVYQHYDRRVIKFI